MALTGSYKPQAEQVASLDQSLAATYIGLRRATLNANYYIRPLRFLSPAGLIAEPK